MAKLARRLKTELKEGCSGNAATARNLFQLPFQSPGLCLGTGILQAWQDSSSSSSAASPLVAKLISVINMTACVLQFSPVHLISNRLVLMTGKLPPEIDSRCVAALSR